MLLRSYVADLVREVVLGAAAHHGRLHVLDRDCAGASTGHGSPLPHLVHGGPGRAGGGEELGGIRGVLHHLQRTAVQASPDVLPAITGVHTPGAACEPCRDPGRRGCRMAATSTSSWHDLSPDDPRGLHVLPYGSFRTAPSERPRVGVAVGQQVLDLTAASDELAPGRAALFAEGTLDRLLAAGSRSWAEVRRLVRSWFDADEARPVLERHLLPATDATMLLPFTVADYVDFYASEHHATNVGRIFRPDSEPLTPNWKHLPIGYHARAGTVVPSGTPVVRPSGQRRTPDGEVVFGPSTRLDVEAEVGFVVGTPSALGVPVPQRDFAEHVFGVCLVNDWSARDVQAWESVPLGPFLGKSFATSVSPWVVPLAALDAARVAPPARDVPLLPYLDDAGLEPWGLDLRLQVRLNGHLVAEPPYATTYWTAAQQLAHLTVNGASLRTGDLYASGTVSGPEPGQRGSLLELSWGGQSPLVLPDGSTRTFLEDGDEVVISALAPGPGGSTVDLGEVRGTVTPAR